MVRQSNFTHGISSSSTLTAVPAVALTTPSSYDKRALTCTSPLPLSHSLTQIMYQTAAGGRLASQMCADGGLELVVRAVLRGLARMSVTSPRDRRRWETCVTAGVCILSNIAIRGNQRLRKRLVDAGVLKVLAIILGDGVLHNELEGRLPAADRSAFASSSVLATTASAAEPAATPEPTPAFPAPPTSTPFAKSTYMIPHPSLLPSLKLTAYLSKYANLRESLHKHGTFIKAQIYTLPPFYPEIRHWAVVCMRNAFRRGSTASATATAVATASANAGADFSTPSTPTGSAVPLSAAQPSQHPADTQLRICGNISAEKQEAGASHSR
ncbi:hypothetical protein HKX48_007532, partial [Thoreauomyces humboldtii]